MGKRKGKKKHLDIQSFQFDVTGDSRAITSTTTYLCSILISILICSILISTQPATKLQYRLNTC